MLILEGNRVRVRFSFKKLNICPKLKVFFGGFGRREPLPVILEVARSNSSVIRVVFKPPLFDSNHNIVIRVNIAPTRNHKLEIEFDFRESRSSDRVTCQV